MPISKATTIEQVTEPPWETLAQLLKRDASLCFKTTREDSSHLAQQFDDLVQSFLLKKLHRPKWITFVQRQSRSIVRQHLPHRLRKDFRSFVSGQLKKARWLEPIPHDIPQSPPGALNNGLDELRETFEGILDGFQSRNASCRIREIVKLRMQGWTYKKIASELGVCERTVRNQLKSLQQHASQNHE